MSKDSVQRIGGFLREVAAKGDGSLLDAGQAGSRRPARCRGAPARRPRSRVHRGTEAAVGQRPGEPLHVAGSLPPVHAPGDSVEPDRRDFQAKKLAAEVAARAVALEQARRYDDVEAGLFAAPSAPRMRRTGTTGSSACVSKSRCRSGTRTKEPSRRRRRKERSERRPRRLAAASGSKPKPHAPRWRWATLVDEITQPCCRWPRPRRRPPKTPIATAKGNSGVRSREKRLQLATAKLDALREFHLARVRHQAALGNTELTHSMTEITASFLIPLAPAGTSPDRRLEAAPQHHRARRKRGQKPGHRNRRSHRGCVRGNRLRPRRASWRFPTATRFSAAAFPAGSPRSRCRRATPSTPTKRSSAWRAANPETRRRRSSSRPPWAGWSSSPTCGSASRWNRTRNCWTSRTSARCGRSPGCRSITRANSSRASSAHIVVSALGNEVDRRRDAALRHHRGPESGTIDAVFRVANPGLRMRPGMRAEFYIVLARGNVMSVPRAALQGDPSQPACVRQRFRQRQRVPPHAGACGQIRATGWRSSTACFPAMKSSPAAPIRLGFAGGGSGLHQEAFDAAHGHKHDADGSEPTAAEGGGAKGRRPRRRWQPRRGQAAVARKPLHGDHRGVGLLLLVVTSFTQAPPGIRYPPTFTDSMLNKLIRWSLANRPLIVVAAVLPAAGRFPHRRATCRWRCCRTSPNPPSSSSRVPRTRRRRRWRRGHPADRKRAHGRRRPHPPALQLRRRALARLRRVRLGHGHLQGPAVRAGTPAGRARATAGRTSSPS